MKFQAPNCTSLMKSQIPSTKLETNSTRQFIVTKNFEFRDLYLVLIWDLACLREAASAKAGAWRLVLAVIEGYE